MEFIFSKYNLCLFWLTKISQNYNTWNIMWNSSFQNMTSPFSDFTKSVNLQLTLYRSLQIHHFKYDLSLFSKSVKITTLETWPGIHLFKISFLTIAKSVKTRYGYNLTIMESPKLATDNRFKKLIKSYLWNRTMLNFCGIVVAILKMATGRNFSMSGINSGHHNLPTYEMALKSDNAEFLRYWGGHFENGDW